MKTPFYINLDIMEKPWGSRYDFLMVGAFIIELIIASVTFMAVTEDKLSMATHIGIGSAYIALLFGAIAHLSQQVKKSDELARNIIAAATAHAGLTTILFVALITIFNAIRRIDYLGMWTLTAPVYFLFITYLTARQLARNYAKDGDKS